MIEEKYQSILSLALESVPAIKRTGVFVEELRNGYARLRMPLEGNLNHVGVMYAGSLFILGEFAGGVIHIAALDYKKLAPIVKEVAIRYRKPAFSDVTLEVSMSREEAGRIEQEVVRAGKADFDLDLEIKNAQMETITLARGTWQVRPLAPELQALVAGL